jgi:repressor LexA
MSDLTPRQLDCLNCVIDHIEEKGESPTVREVAAHLGLRSPHPAYRLLYALYDLGYLTWEAQTTRSIKVLKRPKRVAGPKTKRKAKPKVKTGA